jgi:methionyl-tRNA formyltransferase
MHLAFLGTPEAAVPSLRALKDAGHDVVIVVTRPDRKRGRGAALLPSPVKSAALELGLTVGHSLKDLEGVQVDRAVVVAYGAMIPAALLERIPMLNVHFSLLPRWRGAAPVERAILAGDEETGVAVMSLEVTLDTGPVHAERRTAVDAKSARDLTGELAHLGASALVEVLADPDLLALPLDQVGEATYAEKLTKESFHLEASKSVELLERTVRLGRAFTFVDGRRLKVLKAHSSPVSGEPGTFSEVDGSVALLVDDGSLVLEVVQPEGSTPMSASSWRSGARIDFATATWN